MPFKPLFCLITHPNELRKESNTGVLVQAAFPDAIVVEWHRNQPSSVLLDLLAFPEYQFQLLMPEQYALYQQLPPSRPQTGEPKRGFIILNGTWHLAPGTWHLAPGTWQQARKMYRQSPYLHELPLYSLSDCQPSNYTLRRNQKPGHLCTAEVVAEILRLEGDQEASSQLHGAVADFCDRFPRKRVLPKQEAQ